MTTTPGGRTVDERVAMNLRLPGFLHARVKALAKADGIHLSEWIAQRLEAAANQAEKAKT